MGKIGVGMSRSKRCTKCGETKLITEFYRNRSAPDGFAYWCKKCTYANKLNRQREHKDEYNAYQRQYRETRPDEQREYARRSRAKRGDQIKAYAAQRYREKSEEIKAYIKQWQSDNPGKVKAYQHKYRETHQEERAISTRRWAQNNREKRRVYVNNYYARKKASGGSFTSDEWVTLCEHYDDKCLCCGRDGVPLTIDHVVPISKGGSNDISNIQPLCQSCNSSKNAQIIDYR